ncbi:hypothetical protein Q5X62_03435 [Acinetobacter baumannii]|nr:hypothetical protein [Acinetobacter baumannii]
MIYKFDRRQVEEALEKKGATQPCSRCGNTKFSIMPGVTTFYIDKEYNENVVQFGSSSHLPVIFVACTQCASLTMHGVGGLGLVDFSSKESN